MIIKITYKNRKTYYINADITTVEKNKIVWIKLLGDSRRVEDTIYITDDVVFLSINGDVIRSQHE